MDKPLTQHPARFTSVGSEMRRLLDISGIARQVADVVGAVTEVACDQIKTGRLQIETHGLIGEVVDVIHLEKPSIIRCCAGAALEINGIDEEVAAVSQATGDLGQNTGDGEEMVHRSADEY